VTDNAPRSARPPRGSYIGHLPGIGDVVDALGYPRDKAGFASVSRSLARLCKASEVTAKHEARASARHYWINLLVTNLIIGYNVRASVREMRCVVL
jgi:hypothetical protein